MSLDTLAVNKIYLFRNIITFIVAFGSLHGFSGKVQDMITKKTSYFKKKKNEKASLGEQVQNQLHLILKLTN